MFSVERLGLGESVRDENITSEYEARGKSEDDSVMLGEGEGFFSQSWFVLVLFGAR